MRLLKWTLILLISKLCDCANILMISIMNSESHKITFSSLSKGLINRNHTVTLISPYKLNYKPEGLEEINPKRLVNFAKTTGNRIDAIRKRISNTLPIPLKSAIKFAHDVCQQFLEDPETKAFLKSNRKYDLIILDGLNPECGMGIAHKWKLPFVFINTVASYLIPLSISGSPSLYSIIPFTNQPYSDDMSLVQRLYSAINHLAVYYFLYCPARDNLQDLLNQHFGPDMPDIDKMKKNVSIILQNGHHSVTYPRLYFPNVIEIGCIHCNEPKPLSKDIENFINTGRNQGFIYVSLGTFIRTKNVPENIKNIFMEVFSRLPYQILFKWHIDDGEKIDVTPNVLVKSWFPQQDILGHGKIKAFVAQGGLHSLMETVFYGVPSVMLPALGDQDGNAHKAALDGYGITLEYATLTSDILYNAIMKVVEDPSFKENVKRRRDIFKDEPLTPLERGVHWVEYVIRHKGATHLRSPARYLNTLQYYSIDVILILSVGFVTIITFLIWFMKKAFMFGYSSYENSHSHSD